MGQEQSLASIGKCCSSEQMEEVIDKDNAQTLSFDHGNTTTADATPVTKQGISDVSTGDDAKNQTAASSQLAGGNGPIERGDAGSRGKLTASVLVAVVKIQAAYRGIATRRMIRRQMQDATLNSITQSFATSRREIEDRPPPVRKQVLADGALYSGQVKVVRSGGAADQLVPDGRGKIKWPTGDKYSGKFLSGQPHGEGTKVFAASNTKIEGTFMGG